MSAGFWWEVGVLGQDIWYTSGGVGKEADGWWRGDAPATRGIIIMGRGGLVDGIAGAARWAVASRSGCSPLI